MVIPPLYMTPGALQQLRATVGWRPPETGALLFGPSDLAGIDIVEFDERGSRRASSVVYSPDTDWGNAVCERWLFAGDQRLLTGVVHSHPGDFDRPSCKSGPGLGDSGYAEEALAANPSMQYFFMPIVTRPGTPEVRVTSWVVSREDPTRPVPTDLKVVPASEFPPRVFNPEWLAEQDAIAKAPLDLDRLEALLGALASIVSVRCSPNLEFEVRMPAATLAIALPLDFPQTGPRVQFRRPAGEAYQLPLRWKSISARRPEQRLSSLCHHVWKVMRRSY